MGILRASCLGVLAAAAAAQIAPGSFVATGFYGPGAYGGVWVLDPTRTALVQPAPQTPEMWHATRVAVDGTGRAWFATLATSALQAHIYEVAIVGGQVVFQRRLTAVPLTASQANGVGGLVLHDGRLWFVLWSGLVGHLDPSTPMQTPVFTTAFPTSAGTPNAITTDGRDLFVATWELAAGTGPTLFAIDTAAATPAWRPIANTRRAGPARTTAISRGPDGQLLLADEYAGILRVDPDSGSVVPVGVLPALVQAGDFDPWSGIYCAADSLAQLAFLDLATGAWPHPPVPIPSPNVAGIGAVAEPPFLRFGRGCVGASGEPRMAWNGLPVAGGVAHVSLRGGTPLGSALLVLGFSTTTSALGPLPLAGAAFGAPGCDLLVSPDAVVLHATPAGTASQSLSLPNSPVTAGLVLHAQWLVSAAVNNLGFVASEGLTIRMR